MTMCIPKCELVFKPSKIIPDYTVSNIKSNESFAISYLRKGLIYKITIYPDKLSKEISNPSAYYAKPSETIYRKPTEAYYTEVESLLSIVQGTPSIKKDKSHSRIEEILLKTLKNQTKQRSFPDKNSRYHFFSERRTSNIKETKYGSLSIETTPKIKLTYKYDNSTFDITIDDEKLVKIEKTSNGVSKKEIYFKKNGCSLSKYYEELTFMLSILNKSSENNDNLISSLSNILERSEPTTIIVGGKRTNTFYERTTNGEIIETTINNNKQPIIAYYKDRTHLDNRVCHQIERDTDQEPKNVLESKLAKARVFLPDNKFLPKIATGIFITYPVNLSQIKADIKQDCNIEVKQICYESSSGTLEIITRKKINLNTLKQILTKNHIDFYSSQIKQTKDSPYNNFIYQLQHCRKKL